MMIEEDEGERKQQKKFICFKLSLYSNSWPQSIYLAFHLKHLHLCMRIWKFEEAAWRATKSCSRASCYCCDGERMEEKSSSLFFISLLFFWLQQRSVCIDQIFNRFEEQRGRENDDLHRKTSRCSETKREREDDKSIKNIIANDWRQIKLCAEEKKKKKIFIAQAFAGWAVGGYWDEKSESE